MRIEGITVCINYSEYLALTIGNKELFDRWIVVTIPEDVETISICEKWGVEYLFTTRIYEGGPFCKGKAINDGILKLNPTDWVCHVDADTFLFSKELRKKLLQDNRIDPDNLYSLYGRLCVEDEIALRKAVLLESIKPGQLEDVGLFAGFFQMWHGSMRKFYPEESKNAGLDDMLMRDSYDKSRWVALNTFCIHIGPKWINHNGCGRTSSVS